MFKEFQETRLSEIKQSYYEKITKSFELNLHKNVKEHYENELSVFVDDEMLEAFVESDREHLFEHSVKRYKELITKDPYVIVGHFHNANGKTLLRLHNKEFYGDDIAKKRPLLQKIHKEHKNISGFELGESGFYFRAIMPLFFKGEYIGAFELGINPKKLLSYVSDFNNLEGLIRLGQSDYSQTIFKTKSLDTYEQFLQKLDVNLPKQSTVHDGQKSVAIYSFDMTGIDGEHIGEFVFFQDLTKDYIDYDRALSKSLYLFLFMGIAVLILFNFLIKKYAQIGNTLRNRASLMLNAQENMVMVSQSGTKVLESNRVFLNFFGFNTIKEFSKTYDCVCDLFVDEEGYIQKEINGKNWVDYIIHNPSQKNFVKILKDSKPYIFRISAHEIQTDTKSKEFVITFEDITQELDTQKELEDERDLFSEGPVVTIEWSP
jgi:hypothetical protein